MEGLANALKGNRTRVVTIAILVALALLAVQGMGTKDSVVTILRGLSLGMLVFLVAAGLSLIFGLLDVLNLAHGEMFMLGAYVGWTVFVRPDTFVDVLPVVLVIAAGLTLISIWQSQLSRLNFSTNINRILPWIVLIIALLILSFSLLRFPITIWDPGVFAESPGTFSLALSQGNLVLPEPIDATGNPLVYLLIIFVGSALLALAIAAFRQRNRASSSSTKLKSRTIVVASILLLTGLLIQAGNNTFTGFLFDLSTTWRFFLAMGVALVMGVALGALTEVTLIRPLYSRPMYQLMLTLGLSFIIIEVVRAIWGRPEFTMPKAALFNGSGDPCPATNIGDLIAHQCSTIILFDGRLRVYNELFIIFVGLLVLAIVWIILQKTRIGMIIRAGVQDSEMVEALGINVRSVFTLVFAMGVGLATFGGVLAAPSIGLSTDMGTRFLLLALIALAIGGLTSFPGAAAGSVLVGLLQQFIIKYGQIGINLPFLEEPFKPSPPLVPASVILLMVIILLLMPNGLFGRNE